MKILCIALLSLLSIQAFAFDVKSTLPARLDQPGVDVPPVGSSAFDKLFFNRTLRKYQVPFPLNEMVESIAKISNQPVNAAFFPASRSLQRPVDLSYHPFDFPRIVLSVGATNNLLLRNKLFWSYLEPKNQLEVISYNEELGRFEFQIVKNYSSMNPEVSYSPRAKCLSCHQGHGPILSAAPWNDSASHNNSLRVALAARLNANAEKPETFASLFIEKLIGKSVNVRESIALLDANVRSAEWLLNFQRAYVYGCISRKCRLHLLRSELGLCQTENHSGATKHLRCIRQGDYGGYLESSEWQLASSELSKDQQSQLVKSQFERFGLSRPIDFAGVRDLINRPEFVLSLVDYLKNISPRENPATSRIESVVLSRVRLTLLDQFQFNYFAQERSVFFSTLDSDKNLDLAKNRIFGALARLEQNGSTIFEQRPLDIRELIQAVGSILGSEKTNFQSLPAFDIRPSVKVSSDYLPSFFSIEPLNALVRQCGQCHQSSLGYPPAFLNGPEQVVLRAVKLRALTIKSKIEQKQMPPLRPLQDSFLSSPDREIIIRWLGEFSASANSASSATALPIEIRFNI